METELETGQVRVFVHVAEDAKIDCREVMEIIAKFHAEIQSRITATRRIGFGDGS